MSDIVRMLSNPLAKSASQTDFFLLTLAECAKFGVPPQALALLRDVHSMLGYSKPLGEKQISALAGPLVAWRTDPRQPHFERVVDLERLAFHQRALIAFGGGKPGEMVGRAEIVYAMGNLLHGTSPPEYYEVFQWASVDTLAEIEGDSKAKILADREKDGWTAVADAEVTQPGGRLYATYQEICTSIRREAIAGLERNPAGHPRNILRPMAALAIANHARIKQELLAEGRPEVVETLDRTIEQIRGMFPGLGSLDDELKRRNQAALNEVLEELL